MRGRCNNPVICTACGSRWGYPRQGLCRSCQVTRKPIRGRVAIWSERQIEMLKECYSLATSFKDFRARRNKFSIATGFSSSIAQAKAMKLGLRYMITHPYAPIEERFIRDNVGEMTIEEIGQSLGRSTLGIKEKIYQMGFLAAVRREGYTQKEFSTVMGVNGCTVRKWIETGKVRTHGGKISDTAAKEFLTSHHHLYKVQKVDDFWFKRMIFGEAQQ